MNDSENAIELQYVYFLNLKAEIQHLSKRLRIAEELISDLYHETGFEKPARLLNTTELETERERR